jgi:uncharacterized protein YkwD
MGVPTLLNRFVIVCCLLFVSACASSGRPNEPTTLRGADLPEAAAQQASSGTPLGQAVLRAVNSRRSGPMLVVNATLERAASVHATDMALRNYQAHHSPEGLGPLDRVRAIDDDFKGMVAENIWGGSILRGKSDDQMAAYILEGWSNSPQHRNTLESSAYSQTGVGVARKGNDVYVVQLFMK